LHSEIASGGMATVHLGRLRGAGGFARVVAIKRLHPQYAKDEEFVSMFSDEARLTSRVRHPNVVSVSDVVTMADEFLIVMEYVQGESLSRLTRTLAARRERLPVAIALTIAVDVLYGLHAAHEAASEDGRPLHIVHRDVSPHNVLVGRDGVARIIDFGIAKASSRSQTTTDGQVRGKLAYLSPEQLLRRPVDRRVDVFAASIVVWEMLAGTRLFDADDQGATIARVLEEPLRAPSAHADGIAPALDAIVMRGLERDPDRRFATAKDMAAALEGLGDLARPADVGAWVERVAADVLRERAARVAEIEREESSARPATRDVEPAPRGTEPTIVLREPGAEPQVEPVPSPAPPRRTSWMVATVVFAVVAAGVYGWSRFANPLVVGPSVSAAQAARPVVAPTPELAAPSVTAAPPAAAPSPPSPAPADDKKLRSRSRAEVKRPKKHCTPPFYFDHDGTKHFKPECL
jgi:serine/threonine-protein kinase